jgi:hypothetical protein
MNDEREEWEVELKKQRWYCDDILRHSSWSYAPEIKDFIHQTRKKAAVEAVEKLKEKKTKTVNTGSFHQTVDIRDYVVKVEDIEQAISELEG